MPKRVLIIGGGVAGLTAAQELAERQYDVTLCESAAVPGGKSRSMGVPGSGLAGRSELPAEHGFRFFPGFYKHLPHTMARIPCAGGSVADNLVATTQVQLARARGRSELLVPSRFPESMGEVAEAFRFVRRFAQEFGIPPAELRFFLRRLLQLMVSCRRRRFGQYEYQSWQEFIGADRMSSAYRHYVAEAMSRSLVALTPQQLSTRTGGYTLLQFLFDFSLRPGTYLDRVLNGPTSDVWIQPWLRYLQRLGVHLMPNTRATSLEFENSHITSVGVLRNGVSERIEADYYLLCIPVDSVVQLMTPDMCTFDPCLANLSRLQTSWMCGVIFYLRRDVRVVHGHTNYVDSPWALTSISQPQFWQSQYSPCRYGNGELRGILSVIVSSWDTPGIQNSSTARQCTPSQLIAEIWGQLKSHLNNPGQHVLRDEDLLQAFVAPSLQHDSQSGWTNHEPLFINTVGSWDHRPNAETQIENLFLAGDYVRTNTDVATMESANESARRAVNAILRFNSISHPPCDIWERDEPRVFSPLRKLDELRYRQGNPPETMELESICLPGEDLP